MSMQIITLRLSFYVTARFSYKELIQNTAWQLTVAIRNHKAETSGGVKVKSR